MEYPKYSRPGSKYVTGYTWVMYKYHVILYKELELQTLEQPQHCWTPHRHRDRPVFITIEKPALKCFICQTLSQILLPSLLANLVFVRNGNRCYLHMHIAATPNKGKHSQELNLIALFPFSASPIFQSDRLKSDAS